METPAYVNFKLVLQHTRKVQNLFTLERIAMVTPDKCRTIFVKHVSRPCSEEKTCPRVPSQVGMVGRNVATFSAAKHRTALRIGFDYDDFWISIYGKEKAISGSD